MVDFSQFFSARPWGSWTGPQSDPQPPPDRQISPAMLQMLRQYMTHQAEQPNPAAPSVEFGKQIVKHFADKAASALTAPRDALYGTLQVTDPETGMPTREAMERGQGVAGMAMTGGVPFAQRGAAGIAGGKLTQPGVVSGMAQFPKKPETTFFTEDMFGPHQPQYSKAEAQMLNAAGNEVSRALDKHVGPLDPIHDEDRIFQLRSSMMDALHNSFFPGASREDVVTGALRSLGIKRVGNEVEAAAPAPKVPPEAALANQAALEAHKAGLFGAEAKKFAINWLGRQPKGSRPYEYWDAISKYDQLRKDYGEPFPLQVIPSSSK